MDNSKSAQRRVTLKGMDTQYAKRDALRAAKAGEAALTPVFETPRSVAIPTLSNSSVEQATAQPVSAAASGSTIEDVTLGGTETTARIRLDYRFGLGEDLSAKARALSAQHSIPVEAIIKSARVRALRVLKRLLNDPKLLVLPVIQEGGLIAVVSTSTSGKAAESLLASFDPLGLGLAPAAIRPIVVDLVQKELRAIVEAAA